MTKSIGEMVRYITSDGIRSGTIANVTELDNKTFYRIENGDYVDDSPLVPIKVNPNRELENAFCK